MINKTFSLSEDLAGFEPVTDINNKVRKLSFNSFIEYNWLKN
jgi:hypothetical protein